MKSTTAELEQRAAKREGKPHVYPVVHAKELEGDAVPHGTYEALVAVIGNIDSHGDRIVSGYFDPALEEFGLPPVVWSHDWLTPPIGATAEAREVPKAEAEEIAGRKLDAIPDDGGAFYTKNRLFVDEGIPIAVHVYAAMKAADGDGRPTLREHSFGLRSAETRWVEVPVEDLPPELAWTGGEIRELVKARRIYEHGPTLVGANPATELVAVKSSIEALAERGLLTSDDARKMLREVDDNPKGQREPAATKADLPEELRARIADLDALPHPSTLV